MDAEYVDIHIHLGYKSDVEKFVSVARQEGIALCTSALGPMFAHETNEVVETLMRRYPDTIIGMGYVALGRGDTPETVDDLKRRGFKGLKVIVPTKDYDDAEYFSIYARAEKLGMPILFHTGVIARSDMILKDRKEKGLPVPPHDDPRTFNISSKRMDPMCVDTIARAFPDLNCIMAHFGSTGRRDNCEGIVRWNPNVYADLTSFSSAYAPDDGGPRWHIEQKYLDHYLSILRPLHPEQYAHKFLYGTDTDFSNTMYFGAKKASHKALYNALGIDEAMQRKIFRETAMRLLNLE